VNRTHSETIDGVKLANFMGGSTLNTAMTMASCAAVALYLERLTGLDKMLPIDPKAGTIPSSRSTCRQMQHLVIGRTVTAGTARQAPSHPVGDSDPVML
jgi:hypothetical protein